MSAGRCRRPARRLFAEFQKILMDVLAGRRPPFAAIWMCLFPGQLIEWYPFTVVATTYTPLSPTRTRLRSEYYFDREIAETRRDYVETWPRGARRSDRRRPGGRRSGCKTAAARFTIAARTSQGPYQMPMEQGLRRFHDCLRGIVENNERR